MLQIQRTGLDAAEVVPISLRMLEVIDEVFRGQGHDLNVVDIAFAPFASRVAIILPNYGSYRVPLSGGGLATVCSVVESDTAYRFAKRHRREQRNLC